MGVKNERERGRLKKNKKLSKISRYLKNDDFINGNTIGQCFKSEDLDLTKSIPELSDAAPGTSVHPDPEQPQQGTSKNQSEPYFSVNNIESSPYVTDKGNFKELTDQVKRFVIENGHCKFYGPFQKDSDNRSFLEKTLLYCFQVWRET
ncbi:hypothetical protein EVAR_96558_1 [Eumeta japonica]|uniref:Uncharacterized protein n=1 Tax=Eumeta variegata TaxID=151549 RepID=A0A4C1WEE9_EUMVA|nr:hypothetical protein EVAR_96558_1 [Eumeta japonica]